MRTIEIMQAENGFVVNVCPKPGTDNKYYAFESHVSLAAFLTGWFGVVGEEVEKAPRR